MRVAAGVADGRSTPPDSSKYMQTVPVLGGFHEALSSALLCPLKGLSSFGNAD